MLHIINSVNLQNSKFQKENITNDYHVTLNYMHDIHEFGEFFPFNNIFL